MAGDWIKVERVTPDKPEIFHMAIHLGVDPDLIFAKCLRLWMWFDSHSVDGVVDVPASTFETQVRRICSIDGFVNALLSVGWLVESEDGLSVSVPNFDRHNGESAKKRAQKNRRQTKWRESASNVDAHVDSHVDAPTSTSASTREEKRREENINNKSDEKIFFDSQENCLKNITDAKKQKWVKTYPLINIDDEILKAESWLSANPKKHKDNYDRFLVNWFSRAQQNAPKPEKPKPRPEMPRPPGMRVN